LWWCAGLLIAGSAIGAAASQPVLIRRGPPVAPRPVPPAVPLASDYSLTALPPVEPREVKVHDIVTVIVNEKAEVTEDSRYNRQKQGQFKAELKEFIRLDDDFNLANAAGNSPTAEGRLQSQLNSRGQLQSSEGVRYRIAATVVDVLPNGTVVLEARKTIRTNWDVWEYSLTGSARSADISANNTILSENIADMDIVKTERGRVRDATRRGWLVTLYDWLSPF
jgi:flagellar L-ring protein precursor FlgH